MAIGDPLLPSLTEITAPIGTDLLPIYRVVGGSGALQKVQLLNTTSNLPFTQAGSTVARTLGAKLADAPTLADFGATQDGVTDDYAHFTQAFSAGLTARLIDDKSYAIGQTLTLPAGQTLSGAGTIQAIPSAFASRTLAVLTSGNTLRDATFDGSNLPAPVAGWLDHNPPVGAGLWATGAAGLHLTGFKVDHVTVRNTPSGAAAFLYVDDVVVRDLAAINCQTSLRNDTNANLVVYTGNRLSVSGLKLVNFTGHGTDFNYIQAGVMTNTLTWGGAAGFSALHGVGNLGLVISASVHDGSTGASGNSYWLKSDGDSGLVISAFATNQGPATQLYGTCQAVVTGGVSLDPTGPADLVSANGAPLPAGQTTACDQIVYADRVVRFSAGSVNDSISIAAEVQSDASNGKPVGRVRFDGYSVDGGWCGVKSVVTALGTVGRIEAINWTSRNLAAYAFYEVAQNVDIRGARVLDNVQNGIIAYTNGSNLGGVFTADGNEITCAAAANSIAIQVGSGSALQAGFAKVRIRAQSIDGNANASASALLLDLSGGGPFLTTTATTGGTTTLSALASVAGLIVLTTTGNTAAGFFSMGGLASVAGLVAGHGIGCADFPPNTLITGVNAINNSVTTTAAATGTHTGIGASFGVVGGAVVGTAGANFAPGTYVSGIAGAASISLSQAATTSAAGITVNIGGCDQTTEINLVDILATALAKATPALVTLYANTAQNVVLNMSGVGLTKPTGARAVMGFVNAGGFVGGMINNVNALLDFSGAIANAGKVAGLPSATVFPGSRLIVTDATATAFGGTVVGGGANTVSVTASGGLWVIG